MPNLCQYFGIRFASEQLCAFLKQHKLEDFKRCHFICYISGGFVLRCASALYPLPNLGRIVYLRSPLQERIPELSLQSYGHMLPLLLHGKIMFDLASDWKDNLPDIDAETGYVIEQGISKLARQLGLNSDDYRRYRNDPCFVIAEDRPSFNTPLSHDEVYSDDVLLEQMSRFVTSGAFPSA